MQKPKICPVGKEVADMERSWLWEQRYTTLCGQHGNSLCQTVRVLINTFFFPPASLLPLKQKKTHAHPQKLTHTAVKKT